MKFKTLLAGLNVIEMVGNPDIEVTGVHSDSRRIRKGNIFVSIRGEKSDGHHFMGEAVGAGAAVILCEERVIGTFPSVVQLRVPDTRVALAYLAARFHGEPSESLRTIGITGTNGKTTTSYLIAGILQEAAVATGVIGTLAYRFGNRELPALNTTPSADELQEVLAQMVHAGMKAIVMEVSSHALVQHRVDEIAWDVGIFTNLTQDHLDYHKTMEAYFEAKKLLFKSLGGGTKKAAAILNLDDPRAELLRQTVHPDVRVITYGFHCSADVRAEGMDQSISGCRFTINTLGRQIQVSTPLCGSHNISNCLAAAAVGLAFEIDLAKIVRGIESVKNVPGRLERVDHPSGTETFAVFVDYAHTEDALRNVLQTLRPLTQGRLITVFGCGGNRDPLKRPMMGRVASELSDWNIVTTDNPRFEEPHAITKQIVIGFGVQKNYEIILDRREAIFTALMKARAGDVVLVAGKGHETYQEVSGTRSPFDDRKIAGKFLETLTKSKQGGGVWKN